MEFFTIDGVPVPVSEGGATERIIRAGGLSRTWTGYLRNGIRWEASAHQIRTPILTNAEAMTIRRLTAMGREVTCAGAIIDPAGGSLRCRVLVTDGAAVTTQSTDDGSHTMRTLALEVHPVHGPLLFAYVPQRSIADATYSRNSVATYRTETGLLASAAAGALRNQNYALDPTSGLYQRSTLLEGSRTNRFLHSEDLTQSYWSKVGITISPDATTAPSGAPTMDKLVEDNTLGYHNLGRSYSTIATADNASSTVSFFAKPAERSVVWIQTNTKAGTFPASRVDLVTGVVTTITAGQTVRVGDVDPSGSRRIEVTWNVGAGAGSQQINIGIYNGAQSYQGVAGAGLFIWGLQFEADAPSASSYISTAAATFTRAADSLSFPFPHAPQEMTVYAKFIEGGTIKMTGYQRVLQIGNGSNPAAREFNIRADSGAQRYGAIHEQADGTGGSGGTTPSAGPALGDLVELRSVLFADGSVQIGQATNNGAEGMSARSTAKALLAAWATPEVIVNTGFNTFLAVKIAKGVKSLDQMRLLPPVS